MRILIDTEIWAYVYKKPKKDWFDSEKEYEKQMSLHERAGEVVKDKLMNDVIFMSHQEIAEIWHVLTMRGRGISGDVAYDIIKALLDTSTVIQVGITKSDVTRAIELSKETKIHIWDFLVVLPCEQLDRIYTMDKHSRHKAFQELAPVENPLGVWLTM